jgi:hypothetical protein
LASKGLIGVVDAASFFKEKVRKKKRVRKV